MSCEARYRMKRSCRCETVKEVFFNSLHVGRLIINVLMGGERSECKVCESSQEYEAKIKKQAPIKYEEGPFM